MAFLQQKILILDRGTKYYKGLLIEQGLGNFKILRAEKLPLINDLSFLQETTDSLNEEFLKNELSIFEYNFLRFTKTLFTDENEIVFLFRNDEVFIRVLKIPAEKEDVALDVLENEIEGYLPYNLEEVQIVSNFIKFHNGIADVMGIAIKNELLENYTKVLLENGFSIGMLGIESIALASSIELLPETEYNKKIILQLDIGYSKTILNVIEKGKLAFSRVWSFGIKNLIDIFKSYYTIEKNISEDQVEQILFENFFSILKGEYSFNSIENKQKLIKELKEEWQFFLEELKRTINILDYEYISYVLLSGGGSLIHRINQNLEESLNIQVKYYEIQLANEPIEPWLICIGGFFHYKKALKERVDFLTSPLGKTLKRGEIRLKVFYLPVLITTISVLIFLLSFVVDILLERKQLQFYKNKIIEVAQTIPGIKESPNPVSAVRNLCNQKLEYWKNIVVGKKFLDIIKEIDEHTVGADSARIQFKSLYYTENQIELELEVDSIGNVVKVQEEFQKSRMFSTVEVTRRDLMAGQKVRLGLSLKLKPINIPLGVDCK
jgi:Tfp pilus assembly PilM family ATPase